MNVTGAVFNGHYYQANAFPSYFDAALSLAPQKSMGGLTGHLLVVTHFHEKEFIRTMFSGGSWVGATDRSSENTWVYATGPEKNTVASGVYWSSGEPNGGSSENCMFMSSGSVSDLVCNSFKSNVIEFECSESIAATDVSSCPRTCAWNKSAEDVADFVMCVM